MLYVTLWKSAPTHTTHNDFVEFKKNTALLHTCHDKDFRCPLFIFPPFSHACFLLHATILNFLNLKDWMSAKKVSFLIYPQAIFSHFSEIYCVLFEVYFIKAIDRTFYRFTGVITHAGCWENTRKGKTEGNKI